MKRVRATSCLGKRISITYSECVSVALVIQHVKRMRRSILSCLSCLAVPCFPTLSHKRHDFRNTLLNIKRVFRFPLQLLSETFLKLRRIPARYDQKCILVFMKSTPYTCPILMKLEFSGEDYWEKITYQIS